ncbi:MAG: 30S ribosomal protein S11 [Parcubacteria group bacterium ADurb.Bin305]|jgi:small subunit ribosomal protein S11|nr:30S ribosomal protein S11 [Candidatus Paceibacterota bacterium]OQA44260.1 MAG: 30S ribosomal protein S11 [Parcubacteria group bacterium ADurb.Bin305]
MGKKRIVTKLAEDTSLIGEKMSSLSQKSVSSKAISKGRIYIRVSYNNTQMVITDANGNVLGWASAGALGFKGPKKATPYAASKVAEVIMQKLEKLGMKSADVYIEGIGSGRQTAIYSLATHGLNIDLIKDITPVPHNGPKPPNPRRV